jgi:hypothetical protein
MIDYKISEELALLYLGLMDSAYWRLRCTLLPQLPEYFRERGSVKFLGP